MYRVLLLCSNNSVLSPMAEGYFRHFTHDDAEVYGAGIEVKKPDPLMLKILKEDGVDVTKLRSYSLADLRHLDFDYILTFDEESELASHHLPSKSVKYHYQFDKLLESNSREDKEEHYRNLKNRIKKIIRSFIKEHFTNSGVQ
jgi:arsenate reductase